MIQLPDRKWYRTGLCGCGNCRFRRPPGGSCPQAFDSEGRIRRQTIALWASRERQAKAVRRK